jgi:hypothetical protein
MSDFKAQASFHFTEANRLFKESLTHLHNINMKKTLTIIGLSIAAVLVLVAAIAYATPGTDYAATRDAEIKISDEHWENARSASCVAIAELNLDCSMRTKSACGKLAEAEQYHLDTFSVSASEDCRREEEPEHPVIEESQEPDNPLFFGDEE